MVPVGGPLSTASQLRGVEASVVGPIQPNPGGFLVREVLGVEAGVHRSGVSPSFRILGVAIA